MGPAGVGWGGGGITCRGSNGGGGVGSDWGGVGDSNGGWGSHGHWGWDGLDVHVWLSGDLLVEVGLSGDLLVDVLLGGDLLVHIGLGGDLLVEVGLSWDLGVQVGLGGWVDLAGVVQGVDGGHAVANWAVSDGWGGNGVASIGNWGGGSSSDGWGSGVAGQTAISVARVAGVGHGSGDVASLSGGDGGGDSNKSLHFGGLNELLTVLQD